MRKSKNIHHQDQKLITTLASGMIWVVMGMLIARILGYGIRAIIAQAYGVEKYGYINTALSLMMVLSMLSLAGLNTGLARQISYYRAKLDIESLRGQVFSAYKISVYLGTLAGFLLFFSADYLAVTIFRSPELAQIIKIFAIGIPLFNILEINCAVLKGLREILKFTLYHDVIRFLMILIIIVLLMVLESSFSIVVIAYPLTYLVIDIWILNNLKRYRELFKFGNVFYTVSDKQIISFSVPILFSGMFWFLMARTDTIIIGILLDQTKVGIYNAAVPVGQILMLVREAFSPIILPLFTGLFAEGKFDKLSVLYTISSKWMTMLVLPLFISMLVLPHFYISLIFGAEFITAVPVLRIIIFGYVFHVVMGPLSNILIIAGHTKKTMLNSLAALLVSITLNLILIPKFGLEGAAISAVMAFVIFNILCFIHVYRQIEIKPVRLLYFKFIIAAVLPIPILYISPPFDSIFLSIILYFLCYVVLLIVFRSMKKEDLVVLEAIKRRVSGK
jgi:O-antigen/teichoic acid export membrane protein